MSSKFSLLRQAERVYDQFSPGYVAFEPKKQKYKKGYFRHIYYDFFKKSIWSHCSLLLFLGQAGGTLV
jgi:hypothetical protein